MYLARRVLGNNIFYSLRETVSRGGLLTHRDVIDLGRDPRRYIHYYGGSGFALDDALLRRLESRGIDPGSEELEDIFFDFLDPDVKVRLEPFRHRARERNWRPINREMRERILAETHPFDRRRLHFLRLRQLDQRRMDHAVSMFKVLLDKSRDEIEQLCLGREAELRPRDYANYMFTVFDLQRYFTQRFARTMPEALSMDKMDEAFLKEVCRLDSDAAFWAGFERSDRLPAYLIRYVVMYFDYGFPAGNPWREYIREFMYTHRRYTPPRGSRGMSREEATTVFGVPESKLRSMTVKELTRLYRRKAHELHPDKGGDHDAFIKLTAAYNELLRILT